MQCLCRIQHPASNASPLALPPCLPACRSAYLKGFLLQVAVLANHQNGRDTHVRQVRGLAGGGRVALNGSYHWPDEPSTAAPSAAAADTGASVWAAHRPDEDTGPRGQLHQQPDDAILCGAVMGSKPVKHTANIGEGRAMVGGRTAHSGRRRQPCSLSGAHRAVSAAFRVPLPRSFVPCAASRSLAPQPCAWPCAFDTRDVITSHGLPGARGARWRCWRAENHKLGALFTLPLAAQRVIVAITTGWALAGTSRATCCRGPPAPPLSMPLPMPT